TPLHVLLCVFPFSLSCPRDHRYLPSFPTRRSSDLSEAGLNRHLGVLVGFDGSDLAALAVRSGAVEAERRNTTLTVVTAYALPTMIYPNMASMPSEPEGEKAKREAESTLAEA